MTGTASADPGDEPSGTVHFTYKSTQLSVHLTVELQMSCMGYRPDY
jgi:hypothetical protein